MVEFKFELGIAMHARLPLDNFRSYTEQCSLPRTLVVYMNALVSKDRYRSNYKLWLIQFHFHL